MAEQNQKKLNQLEKTLPEGLLVDAQWMERHGYSTSLRSQYVASGWLTQPVRGTYKRPLGDLTWQRVVVSLQTLLESDVIVGGRTALDLQGLSHYLAPTGPKVVYLYGNAAQPGWLSKLSLTEIFRVHRTDTLFRSASNSIAHLSDDVRTVSGPSYHALIVSTPERAVLELLNELPHHESFHEVDMLLEGLRTLSPKRLQRLLGECRSIKVKRLFCWFAERHNHPWFKQLDLAAIDLGSGKRMLVKGGKLDPKYLITVPSDLNAVL